MQPKDPIISTGPPVEPEEPPIPETQSLPQEPVESVPQDVPPIPEQHMPEFMRDPNQPSPDMPLPTQKPPTKKFKPSKKILIIALAVFGILIGSASAAYFMSDKSQNTETAGTTEPLTDDSSEAPYSSPNYQADDVSTDDPNTPVSNTPGSSNTTPSTGSSSGSGSTPGNPVPTPGAPTNTAKTYTVNFDWNSCFSPSNLTIKKGDTVTFVNTTSNKNMWPASDDHPKHLIYPEFDPKKNIAPKASWSFTFTKIGTWGYHDHNKSSCEGTIKVTS